MKYYAVTDDPRELYHYGRLGMKWGKHIFGDKPKSPGYHKALGKLRATAKSVAKRSSDNRRSKEERKYEKAVQKTQNRIKAIENLYKVDQEKAVYDQAGREYRMAQKTYKMQNRQANRYAKNEAKMDKIMEKARRGKLKYGNLSQDQIERIQDRLNLENQTRRLGSQEKTWHQQKKEARRQGKLQGITRGTAAAMEEVARGATQFGLQGIKNNMILKNQAKQEGKREKAKASVKNKKTRKDFERELHEEVMRAEVRDADSYDNRKVKQFLFGKSQAQRDAERLKDIEQKKIESEFNKKLNDSRNDKYREFLLDVGGSDEENRKAYASSLSIQDQKRFNNLSRDAQRQEVLQSFNKQKEFNEQIRKAAEEFNEERIRKENEEYKIKLNEYNEDMKTYRADLKRYKDIEEGYVTAWNTWKLKGSKGDSPVKPYMEKPKKPVPPVMPRKLTITSGNGGGKKK